MAAPRYDPHGKSKTLFIRNLPYSATDGQLENVFNEIGPVQRCFVVRTKGEEKCKGYGYVKFSLLEDALKAQSKKIFLNGRKLLVHSADKKKKLDTKSGGKRKPRRTERVVEDEEDDDNDGDVDKPEGEISQQEERKRSNQEKKYLRSITLVVSGLPSDYTNSQVAELFQDVKSYNKIIYPVQEVGAAHIRFKSIRDTKRAERKLQNAELQGIKVKAIQLTEHQKLPRDVKRCRLIIRNLSFKCKPELLKETFSKFGQVVEVNIPKKEDGKMKGFAFVQLGDLVSADEAVKSMNGKSILGRPVAVDWALSIDHYKQALSKQQQTAQDDGDDDKDNDDEGNGESEDVVMSDGSSGSEIDKEEQKGDSDDDDDDDDDNDEGDEGYSDDSKSSDEEEEENTEDGSDDDDVNSEKDEKSKKKLKCDVTEGKTVFMRNVSFDTTEAKLKEALEEYGDVKYCKLVKDPVSSHSKGTAFAQYTSPEMAKNLIEESSKEKENEGVIVDGRKLLVTLAVDRNKAEEYREKDKEKKAKKDNRNLYLIREGYIRPGTEAAKSLEKSDINKRLRIEAQKRQKLKNPSVFVSATRLCVHNLPVTLDDRKLRQLFIKVVNDKSSKITECRVMRDLDRVTSQGVGKSRGYAFIEFTKHEHALRALRETNNNPNLFGDKKRLIVEFSLENKQALLAKQKRLERQKAKQESFKNSADKQTGTGKLQKNKSRTESKKLETPNKIKQNLQNLETESKVAKKLYSGPVGFPKHFGPKVRHKSRQAAVKPSKPKQAQLSGNKAKSKVEKERPKKRKRAGGEIKDDFDQLINNYKKKLMTDKSRASHRQWIE